MIPVSASTVPVYAQSLVFHHQDVRCAYEVVLCCMQTMARDCRRIFVVPSFVIILLGEIIMAIGGSGGGYQIMYFEVR